MKKKIIFIDVDGTLVDEKEQIPASAFQAIKEAQKNGHLVYLCTGRSKAEIYDNITALGVDGIIGAGGGFIECQGKMLYHLKFDSASVKEIVDYFNANNFDFYIESNSGLFASVNLKKRLIKLMFGDITLEEYLQHPSKFIEALNVSNDLYRDDINKICFLENPHISYASIKAKFDKTFSIIQCTVPSFGDESGELFLNGVDKGTAIKNLLAHLKIDASDTISIGDGLNDFEMFECCAINIAMGNAKDTLKEKASYVTSSVAEDGIYNALKYYQIF